VSNEVFMAVLRYLYGVPATTKDKEKDTITTMDFRTLCDVANEFGIPSLRKTAVPKMEVYSGGLLEKEVSGTKTGLGDFVFIVRHMYESDIRKDPMAFEMVAKLMWKNFAELRKYWDSNDLMDEHPEFMRAVLDYAAREGTLCQK
jgi:hypothetical protein